MWRRRCIEGEGGTGMSPGWEAEGLDVRTIGPCPRLYFRECRFITSRFMRTARGMPIIRAGGYNMESVESSDHRTISRSIETTYQSTRRCASPQMNSEGLLCTS